MCAVSVLLLATQAEARTRRDVWVKLGATGGDGTRAKPYGGLQEAVDRHDKDWGQVFVCPGVYAEDVVVERDGLWFFPAFQYDVVLQGSITIRGNGICLRGFTFRSRERAIVVGAAARDCRLQNNRVLSLADGGVGIQIENAARAYGNVIDLRKTDAKDTIGFRIVVPASGDGPRLDHNRVAGVDRGIVVEAARGSGGGGASHAVSHFTNNTVVDCRIGMSAGAPSAIVKYNTIRSCSATGLVASGLRCRIEANTLFRNGSSGLRIVGTEVEVFNNVIYGNASVGTALDTGADQVDVRHNTFHMNGPGGKTSVTVGEGTSGVIAANILSGPGALIQVSGQWRIAGNLVSHGEAKHKDQDVVIGDPLFVRPEIGDFHVRPKSPAISAAPPSSDVRQDRDGVGRPLSEPSEIGAYAAPRTPRSRRTIYVTVGAKAGGDGSEERPFPTIVQAVRGLGPGDTVVVAKGRYAEKLTIARSGTPNAPIVIRSEPRHAAEIDQGRITLDDCTHVRIEGFLFRSCPGGVVFGPNARHDVVAGCHLTTLKGKADSTISISGPAASSNVIENCVFVGEGRRRVAIQLACQCWNQHAVIRRNTISGYYYAVQTGGGSYPTAPPGYHVVEECDLFGNGDGVHAKMTDGIIRNNHVHHNSAHGVTVRYGARQLIEGNRIHHNGRGIRLHSPSHLVRNNVVYANKNGGILLTVKMGEPSYEPPSSNFIVNNTFWGHREPTIRIEQGARCAILRNILVGGSPEGWLILREDSQSRSPGEMSGAIRMADFNLYHNGRMPLLREYEGGEHDLYVDPMLVAPEKGDFRLAKDSPARNAIPADWTALPPIPFGADADGRWRTLGAGPEVGKPGEVYGARH